MRFCIKKKKKMRFMIMNLKLMTSNVKIMIIEGLGRVEI